MAKIQTILQVFVASPSDVVDEREILEDVIDEINTTWADTQKVRIELVKWETHTHPGFGDDAQDVINQQIGDEYDIFLGIMWGRFGSPTNRAESGTEEEFERAYARFESIPIMFYFKDAGIPPSKSDLEQLGKVQTFKRKISSEHGGLYHEFETSDEFRTKVRIHLSKLVQEWLKNHAAVTPTTTTTPSAYDAVNPLANLAALDDDEEEGLIELTELASEAMESVGDVIEKMTEAVSDIGNKFQQRTEELKLIAAAATPDTKAIKRHSHNVANDFDVFVKRMSVEIPEFHKQQSTAMEAFGKIAIIYDTDLAIDPVNIRKTLAHIQSYRASLSTAVSHTSTFRDTTTSLPRMTTAFNRARKRAVAVIGDLLAQFRSAVRQSEDVEGLLQGILESANDIAQ